MSRPDPGGTPALDELRRILAPLGLRPSAVARIDKGTVTDNFRVDSDGGPLFVKVVKIAGGKREADLAYEGALLWHLGAHRFPTPQPLRTSSGRPYLPYPGDGERLVTVFPWQAGQELPEDRITAAHAGRVGELVARLHLAAAGFRGQRRGIYTFERIVERLAGIRARVLEAEELGPVVATLDDEVSWLRGRLPPLANLPAGTIHGDVFPDNLLWSGDRIAALVDFEQASRGRYTYDIAVALLACCWRQGALVDGLAWSLVSGYQRVRPLSDPEREALWTEARLAALRFTVTRITDVFLPSLPPRSKPPLPGKDYRDYLARLTLLRDRGADALGPVVGERPPLRAV